MEPIIKSLCDIDFYKFTMAQLVFKHHADVPVRYEFTNRTKKANLLDVVKPEALAEQLAHVATLHFTDEDILHLRSLGTFSDSFLGDLMCVKLRAPEVWTDNDGLHCAVEGRWRNAIWWETIILSIINEMWSTQQPGQDIRALLREGERRLLEKTDILAANRALRFMEFGTRRRFSREWQERVLQILLDRAPWNVSGTSNVDLARRYQLKPMGTRAHELDMAYAGIYGDTDEGLLNSVRLSCEHWWDMYGGPLSFALPDTFGTDFFLRHVFDREMAEKWWGSRQDSGDSKEYGNKFIAHYDGLGIDARRKMIIFSDGLDLTKMLDLLDTFSSRINCGFGWGTNLTNDCGVMPISIVVKLVMAAGRHVAKLSDNIAKAIGRPEVIERFIRVFDAMNRVTEECRY